MPYSKVQFCSPITIDGEFSSLVDFLVTESSIRGLWLSGCSLQYHLDKSRIFETDYTIVLLDCPLGILRAIASLMFFEPTTQGHGVRRDISNLPALIVTLLDYETMNDEKRNDEIVLKGVGDAYIRNEDATKSRSVWRGKVHRVNLWLRVRGGLLVSRRIWMTNNQVSRKMERYQERRKAQSTTEEHMLRAEGRWKKKKEGRQRAPLFTHLVCLPFLAPIPYQPPYWYV